MSGDTVRPDFKFKIIFLGDVDVGKTSLILRFSQDRFEKDTQALGDLDDESRILDCKEGKCKIILTDTGGREGFSTLTSSYYRNANAIVLVYDMTRKETFEHLMDHYKEADRYSPDSQKFVVANKLDLDDERVILLDEVKVRETSAQSGQGVMELFEDISNRLIVEAKTHNPPPPAMKKKSGKKDKNCSVS